jgi:putative flippase GtrA
VPDIAAPTARVSAASLRKLFRYSLVSVVSAAVGQATLIGLYGFARWSAREANVVSCCLAALPSYYLNRRWVWRKSGSSHLLKEIVPFWLLALLGLGFSTWFVGVMDTWARHNTTSRPLRTLVVVFASAAGFGVLWFVKLLVLNRMFQTPAEPMATES